MKMINGRPLYKYIVFLLRRPGGDVLHRMKVAGWGFDPDSACDSISHESEYLDWLAHHPDLKPHAVLAVDRPSVGSMTSQLPKKFVDDSEHRPKQRQRKYRSFVPQAIASTDEIIPIVDLGIKWRRSNYLKQFLSSRPDQKAGLTFPDGGPKIPVAIFYRPQPKVPHQLLVETEMAVGTTLTVMADVLAKNVIRIGEVEAKAPESEYVLCWRHTRDRTYVSLRNQKA